MGPRLAVWLLLRRRQATAPAAPLIWRGLTVPFAIYFLLAVAPIVIGLTVPDRAIAAPVTVDSTSGEAPAAPLPTSLAQVLLMFNVAGDPNPLHNLGQRADA